MSKAREAAHSHWRYEQERKCVPDPDYREEAAALEHSAQHPAGLSPQGVRTTIDRLAYLRSLMTGYAAEAQRKRLADEAIIAACRAADARHAMRGVRFDDVETGGN